ncbi:MAG TPA: MG2 domain-containing protein, partial [Phycisphaerae bacterium]|nr:MG2 domain-containing protein [Phycisphaerae bacterium]
STQPLSLKSVKQVGFEDDQRTLLELEFNDKVIPGEVLSHLEISASFGKTLKATLQGQGAGPIVRVLVDPIVLPPNVKPDAAENLRITLTPGLAGAAGPLGIKNPVNETVRIAHILLAESLTAQVSSYSADALKLEFNNDLPPNALDAIKPLLKLDPPIDFTASTRGNGRQILLEGDFTSGTRYTVTIAKAPGRGGGEGGGTADDARKLPRPAVLSVVFPDREPSVSFPDDNGFLGSNGNRSVLLKAVNVPAVRIRVDRVYENNLVAWRNTRGRYSEGNVDNYAAPIASRRYVLANKKNEPQDLRVNLDDLLGSHMTDGTYRLEVSVDRNALTSGADTPGESAEYWRWSRGYYREDDTALITLSDIGLTAKVMASPTNPATERGVVAWALSLSTGKPLPNIHTRVYSNKNQLLGEGTTDDRGIAQIDHLNPASGETPAVIIAATPPTDSPEPSRALTWLDISSMSRDETSFATTGRPYLRAGYEAFVWPERGVYRPGEEVTLRAIVRGPNVSQPAAHMPIRWQIRRPDGRDWLSHPAQLDADGGVEWKLTIPADAATGYYSALLGLPGDPGAGTSGMRTFGTGDFQVEEFIPDRIKSKIEFANLKEGQRLTLTANPILAELQSDYLFGQPAAHLQSELSVRLTPTPFTSAAFPAAQGWLSGDTADAASALGSQKPAAERLAPARALLDDNGHASYQINIPARTIKSEGAPAETKPAPAKPAPATEPAAAQTDPARPAIPMPPARATAAPMNAPDNPFTYHGPWVVSLSAETTEMGGRAVSAYASAQADELPYYLLVRRAADYVRAGDSVAFPIQLATPEGKPTAAGHTIEITLYRETWNNTLSRNNGRYGYTSTRLLEEEPTAAARLDVPPTGATFTWRPSAPGTYVLQFSDPATHQITTLRCTASENGGWSDSISRDNPEQLNVQLLPADAAPAADKTKPLFRPGQT